MKFMSLKSAAGFTFIELLIVISIIAVMSTLAMNNYRDSQKQYAVYTAAQRLTADLRRAQNMALSGKTQGALVPGLYGVSILSAGQYKIFYGLSDGSSGTVETITLDDVTLSPIGTGVYFTSPASTPSGSQTFTIVNGSYSKGVTVDAGGSISIN